MEKLKSGKVKIYTPHKAKELKSEGNNVTGVVLEHLETGEEALVEVDDVIVLFGFVSSLGPIKEWGVDLNKTALTVGACNQTNIPGVYAAGDSASYKGKVKMITSGFGEAVVSVNSAKAYAYPDKLHRHQHSSAISG